MRRLLVFAAIGWAAAAQGVGPVTQGGAPGAQSAAPASIEELMAAANAKYMHREYAASRDLYEQARQQIEQTANDNPQRFDAMKRLSTVAAAQGDYGAANTYLEAAIDWRIDRTGPSDPQVLAERLRQVGIFRAMADDARAREALEALIGQHEAIGGRRNPDLANDHSLMGQIDLDDQKRDDAIREWELAIAIRGLNAGLLDVTQVPDLDRLGKAYLDAHTYDSAETTFRRALIVRESVLGPEHADLLATLDGLAYAYFGQQKFPEAEAAYQRLLALWVKSAGETHPMVAMTLDKLGVFYAAQKRHEEAQAAYARANAIRALFFAQGLVKQADDAITNGDAAETANALYRRALRALDPPNPLYDDLREKLAEALEPAEGTAAKKGTKTAPKK